MTKIKKVKGTKKCVIKRKINFKNHKNYLKATQTWLRINWLRKNKVNLFGLKKDGKEFIKNNKFILNYNKDLEAKNIMYLLIKLTRSY